MRSRRSREWVSARAVLLATALAGLGCHPSLTPPVNLAPPPAPGTLQPGKAALSITGGALLGPGEYESAYGAPSVTTALGGGLSLDAGFSAGRNFQMGSLIGRLQLSPPPGVAPRVRRLARHRGTLADFELGGGLGLGGILYGGEGCRTPRPPTDDGSLGGGGWFPPPDCDPRYPDHDLRGELVGGGLVGLGLGYGWRSYSLMGRLRLEHTASLEGHLPATTWTALSLTHQWLGPRAGFQLSKALVIYANDLDGFRAGGMFTLGVVVLL